MTNLIKRDICVLTGENDLEHLFTFKKFPVFAGCVDTRENSDVFSDMSWYVSKGTGCIQLNPLIPLDLLYQTQHNEVVGNIWKNHHREFANFIAKYKPANVFEIGGAHGYLAIFYLDKLRNSNWTILDINPGHVNNERIKTIKGEFSSSFVYKEKVDCVVHSHLLEHVYLPMDFMKSISKFIANGGLQVFAVPNLHSWLSNYFGNALFFEHTYFLIEPYIEYMLAKTGFKLIEKRYFEKHSIFYVAEKSSNLPCPELPGFYKENSGLFLNFISYVQETVNKFNKQIEKIKTPVYLFGAHIFAQYLLNLGLSIKNIVCLLDNGPQKIGKRLYGTNLRVESPKILKDIASAHVILKSGVYSEEIKKDILENINRNVVFLE